MVSCHRLASGPPGTGSLTGKIDEKGKFDGTDFRNILPRSTSEAMKTNRAFVDLLGNIGGGKRGLLIGPRPPGFWADAVRYIPLGILDER